MAYRVKAVTAVIKVGGTEKYLHRGSIVPPAATNIEHLLAVGLLEEIELLEVDTPELDVDLLDDADKATDQDDEQRGDGSGELPVPPPKAGQGASAEAWRNYAEALDVEVADDASRADAIAAIEAADKPTE